MNSTAFTKISFDSIQFTGWLTFDEAGSLKFTRGRPSLTTKERALKLQLTIPRAIFRTPELSVAISVDEPGRSAIYLHAVARTIAEAVTADSDLKVEVTIPPAVQ